MTKPKPKPTDLFPEAANPPAPAPRNPKPHVPKPAPRQHPTKVPPSKPVPRPVPPKPPKAAVPAVVNPPQPVSLLALVGQAIANPEIDGSKLTALVDWYDKREADNAFAKDFLAMAKLLPSITKDGLIDQGVTRSGRQGVKSRYATFPNIHRATSKILHDHGFTLSTYNTIRGEQTVVVLRLEHYDQRFGSSFRESTQPILRDDSAGKTLVQQWGSGEQYQLRRMVIKLLNLRSEDPVDDDRDGDSPAVKAEPAPVINAEQLAQLRAKIAVISGITEKKVCEKYELKKLEDMPTAKLQACHQALDNFRAARDGN